MTYWLERCADPPLRWWSSPSDFEPTILSDLPHRVVVVKIKHVSGEGELPMLAALSTREEGRDCVLMDTIATPPFLLLYSSDCFAGNYTGLRLWLITTRAP